jgi:hypothetical protein
VVPVRNVVSVRTVLVLEVVLVLVLEAELESGDWHSSPVVVREPGDTGLAEAVRGKQQVRVPEQAELLELELELVEEAEQRGQTTLSTEKLRRCRCHRQPTTASSVAEPAQSRTDSLAAARAQWHHRHKALQYAFAIVLVLVLALEEDILRKPAGVLLANTAATGVIHTEVDADADAE